MGRVVLVWSCPSISSIFISVYLEEKKRSKIKDKGLSFGENSVGEIFNVDFRNAKLGIAVKDGSKLNLSKYRLIDNEYDLAVFNKKKLSLKFEHLVSTDNVIVEQDLNTIYLANFPLV